MRDSGTLAILERRYEKWQPAVGLAVVERVDPGHGVIFESNLLKKANALPKG